MSNTDELKRLAELHRNGDLTDEEFAAAKKMVFESSDDKRADFFRSERPGSIPNSNPIPSDYTQRSGRPMSSLELPSSVAPQVIVKAKEGCFLQTLNVGCMIIAGFILLFLIFFLFAMISKH